MNKIKTFTVGGIHPDKFKITSDMPITEAGLPEVAYVPVKQHIGAPAKILVKKGDKVKVGTLIADADGIMSADVHSPVSGEVTKVEEITDAIGYLEKMITIKVEGDEWEESIDRSPDIIKEITASSEEIIKIIREAGIVGMGGAGFPTPIKVDVPEGKKVDCIILNGIECEPYLTADDRLMSERAEQIIIGAKILNKALSIQKAIIAIDENKPRAIEKLTQITKRYVGVNVAVCKSKYPQGGEKQLIDAVLGRQVPSGGLPASVGVVVQNVATAYAVKQAVVDGIPLVERIVTVTGPDLPHPGNYRVAIGTPLSAIISAAGGMPESTKKVILGGPMMGKAASNLNATTNKGTSGILIVPERYSTRETPENCVRCASCVSVCPMGLEPYLLAKLSQLKDYGRLEAERVMDCIECGSCSYICISHRPLLDHIRIGKAKTGAIIKSRKSK